MIHKFIGKLSFRHANNPSIFSDTRHPVYEFQFSNELLIDSTENKCAENALRSNPMRPYSAARDASRGAARPLVLATVLFAMILLLLYFLINYPLVMSPAPPFSPSPLPNTTNGVMVAKGEEEEVVEIYKNLDDPLHRRQVPLTHLPFLYEIRMKLFLPWRPDVTFGADDFSMEGQVRMHFVSGGGSRILLHSDSTEQHIGDCVVRDEFGREIYVKHVGRGHSQVLDLHLSADMINGMNYTLDVAFRGYISTHKHKGLFALPYESNNETRYMIGTHLQMSEARTVFPCIDVPEVKAHFDTIIVHPIGTNAIANMMENNSFVEGSWKTTVFHRTPPMSTYLFAISVSDFPYLEMTSPNGVRTRVYCEPSKIENTRIVLQSTGPVVQFFEDYFRIPYPLDKLDIVILPALVVAAMENWGLITIRQSDALFSPEYCPAVQKHNVQEVISHEIAHQWFGNLVTMKWWNNLWLNEGFATMIGVKAVDFLENTTFRYNEMTAEYMCHVLRADQEPQAQAVSTKGDDEVQRDFSANQKMIIYRKAAIIIRMIERLVQSDIFQQGLHRFLSTFMYKNADHDDLFNVLSYVHDSSSGGHLNGQNFSLSDVMDTWLRQSSFPVVHVNRKEGSIVTLRQERYRHVPLAKASPKDAYIWKIPIFFDDPVSGKHKVFWITDKQPVLFDLAGQTVIDPYQLTYMRLRYDESMYSDITMRLIEDHSVIPTNSRSRLIDDTLAMAEHGQISYRIPFNMTLYLPNEKSYRPFQTFSAYLDFFIPRMYYHEDYEKYRKYLLMVLSPQYDRVEKEGLDTTYDDDVDYYKHRELIVFRSCHINYKPCVEMARKRFEQLRKSCSSHNQLLSDLECNTIPFYLRQYVYFTAIEHGTREDFEFLFTKWRNEKYVLEKERIWYGMCGTNTRNDSDLMWLTMLKNRARENVLNRAIGCSKKITNQTLLLDLLIEKSDQVKKILHKSYNTLEVLVHLINRQINTEVQLEKVKKLLETYPEPLKHYKLQRFQGSANGKNVWRKKVAPWIIGNATETVNEMQKIRKRVISKRRSETR